MNSSNTFDGSGASKASISGNDGNLDDIASGSSTQSLMDLQQQIIKQSKSIKQYILDHRSQNGISSETFAALESLFELFQSEVSMNIALRKAVLYERRNHTNIEPFNQIEEFLNGFNKKYGTCFNSLSQITEDNHVYMPQFKSLQKSKNDQVYQKDANKSKSSNNFETIHQKLKEAHDQIIQLESKLSNSQAIISKQRNVIKEYQLIQKKQENNDKKQVLYYGSSCMNQIQLLNDKLSSQKEKYQLKIQRIEEDHKKCEAELHQKIERLNRKVAELIPQNIDFHQIQELKENNLKLVHRIDQLRAENADLKKKNNLITNEWFQNKNPLFSNKIVDNNINELNNKNNYGKMYPHYKKKSQSQKLYNFSEENGADQKQHIHSLLKEIEKLRKERSYFKKLLKQLISENTKIQNHTKAKSACKCACSSMKDAFFNIQELLGIDHDTPPQDTFSAVSSIVCRLRCCM